MIAERIFLVTLAKKGSQDMLSTQSFCVYAGDSAAAIKAALEENPSFHCCVSSSSLHDLEKLVHELRDIARNAALAGASGA